jgi:hypothetical protein
MDLDLVRRTGKKIWQDNNSLRMREADMDDPYIRAKEIEFIEAIVDSCRELDFQYENDELEKMDLAELDWKIVVDKRCIRERLNQNIQNLKKYMTHPTPPTLEMKINMMREKASKKV